MLGRQKLLLLIPAIVLIPILLGMTPLNFIQKIGSGCPFSQDRQTLKCNPCPFNSVNAPGDPILVSLNSAPLEQDLMPSLYPHGMYSNSILFNTPLKSLHLRC
jgi:hypothetical protein